MGNLNKFEKNRSVDHNWYQVPWWYLLNVTGANTGKKSKKKEVPMTFEEAKAKYSSVFPKYNEQTYKWQIEHGFATKTITIPGEPDKTLAIIQLFGKKGALCAWRNEETYKMGMARMYPTFVKDRKLYLVYKGRNICISALKSGKVL